MIQSPSMAKLITYPPKLDSKIQVRLTDESSAKVLKHM